MRSRQLDWGNAQRSSIGSDFGRLGIDFWQKVDAMLDDHAAARRAQLGMLNEWRNAIAHQDFDPAKLGGTITLHLGQVKRWRVACNALARVFDEVLHGHLEGLIGVAPW